MTNSDRIEEEDNDFILPYQSPQITKQIDILKAYYELSEEGKRPVEYKEIAELVGISDVTISGNHKFFTYCGFLENIDGEYIPSEHLVEFINKMEWKKLEEARKLIRKLFEKKWFSDHLLKLMKLRKKMSKDEIINELGIKAGIKRSRNNIRRLNRLFEWIEYAEIISESDDGSYELTQIITNKEIKEPLEGSFEKPNIVSFSKRKILKEIEFPLILAINITPETTKEELKKMVELARGYTNKEFIETEGGANVEKS